MDILWLSQQGFHVLGVELSASAIESFFKESGLQFEKKQSANFVIYRSSKITLYQGNFMDLTAQQLESCQLVYDPKKISIITKVYTRS